MNKATLKPINKRKDFKEVSSKGGKNSGKARAEYKTFREALQSRLIEDNTQEKIIESVIKQAKAGNIRAFEAIVDRTDGRPRQALELTKDNTIEIIVSDELRKYAD